MRKTLFLLLLLSFTFIPHIAFSQTAQEQLEAKTKEIQELEGKIADLQSQAVTLGNQITIINNQIQVTLLKISQTEEQINLLSGKIDKLEISLDHFSHVLENRVSHTYRQAQIDPIWLFFSSNDLPNFLARYKYLKVIQAHDRKLLAQIAQTQANYETQKNQEENLKTQLESQRSQLGSQIKQKEHLLEVTKNDEKRFQQLLSAAKAEQEAIRAAMATLDLKDGSPVNKGDTIALIGNSGAPGCSSGPHLHFEVVRNGSHQDPSGFLKPNSVYWDNSPDGQFGFSGSWDWPIENPRITQGFGMTYWAKLGWYNGNGHTGIDMASESITIRAPESGTLYKGNTLCRGSTMNYVAIDHGDGLFSWYWHVR